MLRATLNNPLFETFVSSVTFTAVNGLYLVRCEPRDLVTIKLSNLVEKGCYATFVGDSQFMTLVQEGKL